MEEGGLGYGGALDGMRSRVEKLGSRRRRKGRPKSLVHAPILLFLSSLLLYSSPGKKICSFLSLRLLFLTNFPLHFFSATLFRPNARAPQSLGSVGGVSSLLFSQEVAAWKKGERIIRKIAKRHRGNGVKRRKEGVGMLG